MTMTKTYTDALTRLYLDQVLDDIKDLIEENYASAPTFFDKLEDKLARLDDEIDTIYDKAYDFAEALEEIEDALYDIK